MDRESKDKQKTPIWRVCTDVALVLMRVFLIIQDYIE